MRKPDQPRGGGPHPVGCPEHAGTGPQNDHIQRRPEDDDSSLTYEHEVRGQVIIGREAAARSMTRSTACSSSCSRALTTTPEPPDLAIRKTGSSGWWARNLPDLVRRRAALRSRLGTLAQVGEPPPEPVPPGQHVDGVVQTPAARHGAGPCRRDRPANPVGHDHQASPPALGRLVAAV